MGPSRWGGQAFPIFLGLIFISSLFVLFSSPDPTLRVHAEQIARQRLANNQTELVDWQHLAPSRHQCSISHDIRAEYGDVNIRLSRVHEGSRFRLANVLRKAELGDKIKVAVLGGSVSTGHGFADGKPFQYGAIQETWWTFVRDELNAMFGPDRIEFVDGARPAVDSAFFRYCFPALIGTQADLVLVETAVNDVYSPDSLDEAEDLLRAVLQLPNAPAVIFVDSFALRTKSGRDGMLNGGDAHAALSAFYDVPQISVRGPILPSMLEDKALAEPYFKNDVRHIAAPLHRFLGRMVVALLQDTRCRIDQFLLPANGTESEYAARTEQVLGKVPALKISDDWNAVRSYPVAPPTCHIAGDTLEPAEAAPRWALYVWKDAKKYLETKDRNAEVVFRVSVREGGVGTVAISYLKSKQYGLGKLTCSVGEQRTTVDGYWTKSVSVAQTAIVATGLAAGQTHELRCRTPLKLGPGDRTAFRLMSVMTL